MQAFHSRKRIQKDFLIWTQLIDMLMDLTRGELWDENVQFYRELITKHKFEQEPMLALFPQLKKAGFFEKYFPSNSHEALGISTKETYALRCQTPMVYIIYLPIKQCFVVHYQKSQGNTIMEEDCGSSLSEEVLIKIQTWLDKT